MKWKSEVYKKFGAGLCAVLLIVTTMIPAFASVKQSENTKVRKSSNGNWSITAYAAFDRFATVQSNANTWDYCGKSTVTNPPVKGTNSLTIKTTASLKNGASLTVGAGATVSAGMSSSWTTASVKKTYKKSAKANQTTRNTEVTNLIVQPKKDYRTNTAGITVTASFTWGDNGRTYSISTAA